MSRQYGKSMHVFWDASNHIWWGACSFSKNIPCVDVWNTWTATWWPWEVQPSASATLLDIPTWLECLKATTKLNCWPSKRLHQTKQESALHATTLRTTELWQWFVARQIYSIFLAQWFSSCPCGSRFDRLVSLIPSTLLWKAWQEQAGAKTMASWRQCQACPPPGASGSTQFVRSTAFVYNRCCAKARLCKLCEHKIVQTVRTHVSDIFRLTYCRCFGLWATRREHNSFPPLISLAILLQPLQSRGNSWLQGIVAQSHLGQSFKLPRSMACGSAEQGTTNWHIEDRLGQKDDSLRFLARIQEVHTSGRAFCWCFCNEQLSKGKVVTLLRRLHSSQRPCFSRNCSNGTHVPVWPAQDRLLESKARTNQGCQLLLKHITPWPGNGVSSLDQHLVGCESFEHHDDIERMRFKSCTPTFCHHRHIAWDICKANSSRKNQSKCFWLWFWSFEKIRHSPWEIQRSSWKEQWMASQHIWIQVWIKTCHNSQGHHSISPNHALTSHG